MKTLIDTVRDIEKHVALAKAEKIRAAEIQADLADKKHAANIVEKLIREFPELATKAAQAGYNSFELDVYLWADHHPSWVKYTGAIENFIKDQGFKFKWHASVRDNDRDCPTKASGGYTVTW